jgi:DNA-binding Lrp family transcriptional regulator
MNTNSLSEKEKIVLHGLVKYPDKNDMEISRLLKIPYSTFFTIKQRLAKQEYFKKVMVPAFHNLGLELMEFVYLDFNPSLRVEDRVRLTKKKVEIFDEIFYSTGELTRGFSFAFAKNYSTISQINEIRTQLFFDMGLMGDKLPIRMIFPFDLMTVYRFFDFEPLLRQEFGITSKKPTDMEKDRNFFKKRKKVNLTKTEKNIIYHIVKSPNINIKDLGEKLGISRLTVSKVNTKLLKEGLIKPIVIPNLKLLGFEIIGIYMVMIDPNIPVGKDILESSKITSPSVVFNAKKSFDAIIISVYKNYDDYILGTIQRTNALREYTYLGKRPISILHSITNNIIIKDMEFAPLLKKCLWE